MVCTNPVVSSADYADSRRFFSVWRNAIVTSVWNASLIGDGREAADVAEWRAARRWEHYKPYLLSSSGRSALRRAATPRRQSATRIVQTNPTPESAESV